MADSTPSADTLGAVLRLVTDALGAVAERDWSTGAAGTAWSCWQTVDHLLDCLLSYTLQVAGGVHGGWLALQELHARSDANPPQLVQSLGAAGNALVAVLRDATPGMTASDGVHELDGADGAARAMYELLLHGHDVLVGLGVGFRPPPGLCEAVLASAALGSFDRDRAGAEPDPWGALLAGAGRKR